MLQINTARAGLITVQMLADSQQPQAAFEAREAFLRAAVPLLQRHKSPTDAQATPAASVAPPPVVTPAAPQVSAVAPETSGAARADASSSDTLASMSAVGEISVHSPTPSTSGHVVYCVTFKVP